MEFGYSLEEIAKKYSSSRYKGLYYLAGVELVSLQSISAGYYAPTMMLFNGKPCPGESIYQAAIRETKEESGVDISKIVNPSIQSAIRKELAIDIPLHTTIYGYFGASFYYLVALNDTLKISSITKLSLPQLLLE